MPVDDIQYSERYSDKYFEYRHVILPPDLARIVPRTHLLSETEWRNLGVQQSPGWVHYLFHSPEPHVLLFRRNKPKGDQDDAPAPSSQSQNLLSQQSQVSISDSSQATSTTSTNAVVCAKC